MPINSAEMPGSSQRRSGHTQQEHKSVSNKGLQPLAQPYHADPTAEALYILEEVMSSTQPNLAECEIIRIIAKYDDKEQRELVSTLREKVIALKARISSKEDDQFTMWLLRKTLQSNENPLISNSRTAPAHHQSLKMKTTRLTFFP